MSPTHHSCLNKLKLKWIVSSMLMPDENKFQHVVPNNGKCGKSIPPLLSLHILHSAMQLFTIRRVHQCLRVSDLSSVPTLEDILPATSPPQEPHHQFVLDRHAQPIVPNSCLWHDRIATIISHQKTLRNLNVHAHNNAMQVRAPPQQRTNT